MKLAYWGEELSLRPPRPEKKTTRHPATVDDDAERDRPEQSVEAEIGLLDHDPAGDDRRHHPRDARQQRRRHPACALARKVQTDAEAEQAIERRDVPDVGEAGGGDLLVRGEEPRPALRKQGDQPTDRADGGK